MWWEQAAIYQVYVRSFQDTDGDGVGDLPGVTQRLGHIADLGAQALWLSPIYPSPNADFGYDVSDFRGVEPAFGTLADLDALVAGAHERGLKVLLDFVPCHTSIEHPWFRQHPDYYVWTDTPNNWRAAFGGSSWGYDEQRGRYFLHSFFPEQADLNWRNPEVREQMTDAMRFWLDRGIDGFRLDALDRLMKDAALRDDPPATRRSVLPGDPRDLDLDHVHSRNAPDIGDALQAIRRAVGDEVLLIGEVYLPIAEAAPYLEALDVVFNFEELFAVGDAGTLRQAIASGLQAGGQGWVLSNHDFSRLATRAGPENARAVALLLLSLPGPVFLFEGDELGVADTPMEGRERDRNHRDPFRAPMVWDSDAAHGGFSTATPWLQPIAPTTAGVAQQVEESDSTLALTRGAMARRSRLTSNESAILPSSPGVIALRRGDEIIAVNLGDEPAEAPARAKTLELEARAGDGADLSVIPAHGGWVGGA